MSKHARKILSKWAKHEALRKHADVSAYMPETRRMTRSSLKAMLEKYGMVYVKPVVGSLGNGVMKVVNWGRGFSFQLGTEKRAFANFGAGYAALLGASKHKPYMVQQGIRLATFRGRPFDLRIMVQRLPRGPWTVTGMLGRVAHPRKIVTNGSQGGTIYPVDALLPGNGSLQKRLHRIGLMSARRLHRVYPGLVEIGLDIAVDRRKRPWILEANTRPDPCPFTKLHNRHMLGRILRFQRAWGIRRRLHCVKARRGV